LTGTPAILFAAAAMRNLDEAGEAGASAVLRGHVAADSAGVRDVRFLVGSS